MVFKKFWHAGLFFRPNVLVTLFRCFGHFVAANAILAHKFKKSCQFFDHFDRIGSLFLIRLRKFRSTTDE